MSNNAQTIYEQAMKQAVLNIKNNFVRAMGGSKDLEVAMQALTEREKQITAPLFLTLPQSVKERKIAEIKGWCAERIVAGIDLDMSRFGDGVLHYSFDQQKQDDLKMLYSAIQNGATEVVWRDDSRADHEVYSAEKFLYLFAALTVHTLQCKLRSDSLEVYVNSLEDTNEIEKVDWYSELPVDILQKEQLLLATQLKAFGIELPTE